MYNEGLESIRDMIISVTLSCQVTFLGWVVSGYGIRVSDPEGQEFKLSDGYFG